MKKTLLLMLFAAFCSTGVCDNNNDDSPEKNPNPDFPKKEPSHQNIVHYVDNGLLTLLFNKQYSDIRIVLLKTDGTCVNDAIAEVHKGQHYSSFLEGDCVSIMVYSGSSVVYSAIL